MKSFSRKASTKIPQSPWQQSKPRGPQKCVQLWKARGRSRARKWKPKFWEKGSFAGLVIFASDHAENLQKTVFLPQVTLLYSVWTFHEVPSAPAAHASPRPKLVKPSARILQRLLPTQRQSFTFLPSVQTYAILCTTNET